MIAINVSFYPLLILKVVVNKEVFKIMLYQSIIGYLDKIKDFLYKLYEYKFFKMVINLEKI